METLAPDRVLGGRYRLRRELARGGMATVWEAEDRVLARRVAIKVLHPHLAGDDGFRVRFRREAVAAARLAHPHIVTTYDTGRDSNVAYIVMELVEGTTLARLLQTEGPLPIHEAVEIACQVADALACAHTHGVIHRDVKPANILLRPDGHVKVADFGIAKAGAGNDLTRTGVVLGTAKYLSPEQVSGNPADACSDVYALGIVLYEMLCGAAPFVGDSELSTAVARLTAAPESLRERRSDVPPSLEAVVQRALARDPAARFRSAEEMRAGLLAVDLDNSDSPTPPAGIATIRPPVERKIPVGVAAGVGALLLLLLGVPLVLDRDDAQRKSPSASLASPAGPAVGPEIAGPVTFDPEAADGEENQAQASHLTDGDPASKWKTDTYTTAAFGNLKSGVGVYVDLGQRERIRTVRVEGPSRGWTGEVYVADEVASSLSGWGKARATGTGSFDTGGVKGRYVLVWFTSLPPAPDGGYRLEVSEIEVEA